MANQEEEIGMILCNSEQVSVQNDYYSLEARQKGPKVLLQEGEQENLPQIISSTFSEDVEFRIHLVDFINHYLVDSQYVNTILTGYDLLKMLGRFYLYYKKKKEPTAHDKPEPDNSDLSTMFLSRLSFEEFEKEWFVDDLSVSGSFGQIRNCLWDERQRVLSILSDLSERYLQKDNYQLYTVFRKWYDWINEILQHPLEQQEQPYDKDKLLHDWVAINVNDSQEEDEVSLSENSTPLWTNKQRYMSVIKEKVRRYLKYDEPDVWKSRMRYAHFFGLLMGLGPDVLIAVAAIEGVLLLTALIRKKTELQNSNAATPVKITLPEYMISLDKEHLPLPKQSLYF